MSSRIYSTLTGAAVALALACPALADVTAQQVRDQIVGLYESAGATVEIGTEEKSGNTLTLSNVSVTADIPNDGGQIAMSYSLITLTESGDGSVTIGFPTTMGLTADIRKNPSRSTVVQAHLETPDLISVVGGSPDALTITTNASKIVAIVDKLTTGKKVFSSPVTMTLLNVGADYTISNLDGGRRRYTGSSSLGAVNISANAEKPGGGGHFDAILNIANISASLDANFALAGLKNPEILVKNGFNGTASYDYGQSDVSINFQDDADMFAMNGGASGGHFGFKLSNKSVAYDISESGVSVHIEGSKLPVPAIDFAYDELSLGFAVPLAPGGSPQDFNAGLALRGATVNEEIWSIIDPGKVLARDPATFALDLSGTLLVLSNLFDPSTVKNLNGPPFLPASVDLNELTVAFAGALLTGQGSATFNFQGGASVGGVPLPVGQVTLNLKGGFGLMDKLVTIGLIPENMSFGLRAMLGAFSRPIGEDELETVLESTSDGKITANGQPLKLH